MTSTPGQPSTPGTAPTTGDAVADPADETAALQAALAGEHAAVYGYGVVGALLDGDRQADARTVLAAHEHSRDRLRDLVRSAGATPVAAHAAYRLPFDVADAESARRLAAEIEWRLTDVYIDLVAATTSADLRKVGVAGAVDSTRRAVRWSGESVAFPGLQTRPGSPVSE